MADRAPYIVLMGDVGTGKSTILEKLTGEKCRSSPAFESFTRETSTFLVPDGSLIIADTPGSNTLKEQIEQNVCIAAAINFKPVSKIFIVVKAENRIDTVIDNVRKYADRLLDFPMDAVAVLVTHMDLVTWRKETFLELIDQEIGICEVVCSGKHTLPDHLLKDILFLCTTEFNLNIDNENFFQVFKIHSNHRKILKCTSDEVNRFTEMKNEFNRTKKLYSYKDLVDLTFEIQAYMTEEIEQAQKRMSEQNNFTFLGESAATEAGHVANMVNQLRVVLYDIRVEASQYQAKHGVTGLRRCPHCNLIWTKFEGCSGRTICGSRQSIREVRSSDIVEMGTFMFTWVGRTLRIRKLASKRASSTSKSGKNVGCGKSINWTEMPPVSLPAEFNETVRVCTNDFQLLPREGRGVCYYLRYCIQILFQITRNFALRLVSSGH